MLNKEIEEQIQYTFKYGSDFQKFCLFLCLVYIANNKGVIESE